MTVTGVDVYWCCIGATLNLHTYCNGTGDDYDVMAAQKRNDSTALLPEVLSNVYRRSLLFLRRFQRSRHDAVALLNKCSLKAAENSKSQTSRAWCQGTSFRHRWQWNSSLKWHSMKGRRIGRIESLILECESLPVEIKTKSSFSYTSL